MIQTMAERGATISAIARAAGADRKTVRRALRNRSEDAQPAGHSPRPSLLDPYKDYIKAQLEVADFTAQRLLQDIRAQGYQGGYNLVKRFVAPLREEKRRRAVLRFETLPGLQAQVDWAGGFGTMEVDGKLKHVSCFSMVLGYSRYQYVEFTLSRNLSAFLACHVHAFEYFGGVPAEVLYDNLKTAVLSHVDGAVEWLPRFADFAACYGFTPRACRPYRAQTKGKVERPFGYIRSNFFLGRSFRDLADLNAQARAWLEGTANVRLHGTTGERPRDRFEKERASLRPLPQKAFPTAETVFRSSTRDCLISYGGNFYSVPHRHAARRGLRVEVEADHLCIWWHEEMIARHSLCQGKRRRIIDPAHLEGLRPESCLTPTQKRLEELRSLGAPARAFIDGLVRTETRFLPWQLRKLEGLLFKVGPETLQKAMEHALRFGAYDARTLENLCRKWRPIQADPVAFGDVLSRLAARWGQGQVELRDLGEYDRAFACRTED